MLSAQHLYDSEAEIKITNCYNDPKLQVRQIDSLIDAGVDLLIVAPYEYTNWHLRSPKQRRRVFLWYSSTVKVRAITIPHI
ncbi:hypothetical protein [Segatella paludivivens]|uniref:hypothetical protein n=1 Tax=Segatella paludivivens TaxID=185294 RepID=UPI001EE179F5|nr:hypothetical protein [Segatella paludivivens]